MHGRHVKSLAAAISNHRSFSYVTSLFAGVLGQTYSTMEALSETEPKPEETGVPCKQRTRYNGRIKKRAWEERGTESTKRVREGDEPFERIKKKKVVMLLGYSGVDYYGMQRNPGVNTIEEELCSALLRAGYIDAEAFSQMQQIQFQRAARTDKGVSAARQVVSVKMPEEADPEKINESLPACIRVFGIKRVTKGFNSKTQCDARTYSYLLPSFAFEPNATTPEAQREYRLPQDKTDAVNQVLNHYKGTKNYYNFTSKKDIFDPSCLRFIMSFQVDKVFIDSDMEFAILKVKGQSFMLHQIRKMVALALAVVRGCTPVTTIEKAFTNERVCVPIAPALGLLLEQVHYDKYDARYGKDGIHRTLDWAELDEVIEEFKMNFIVKNIVKTEIAENSMSTWLETLPVHTYDSKEDTKVEENISTAKSEKVDCETKDV